MQTKIFTFDKNSFVKIFLCQKLISENFNYDFCFQAVKKLIKFIKLLAKFLFSLYNNLFKGTLILKTVEEKIMLLKSKKIEHPESEEK